MFPAPCSSRYTQSCMHVCVSPHGSYRFESLSSWYEPCLTNEQQGEMSVSQQRNASAACDANQNRQRFGCTRTWKSRRRALFDAG
jgi:hypothetical protein